MGKSLYALLAVLTIAGCEKTDREPAAVAEPEVRAEHGAWGVDLAAIDTTTSPGDDFYRFVNGNWLDTLEIPPDRSRWGTFDILRERSTIQVRAIIEELQQREAAPGTVEQKVRDFYSNWMNTEQIGERGTTALKPHLDEIAAIDDRDALVRAFSSLHNTTPFGLGIIPDPADTTRYIVVVAQSGLGMPDREYYLSEEQRFVDFRAAYRDYVVTVHELAELGDPTAKADAIIALETELAQVHWTPSRSRQISEIYNPMSREELVDLAPHLDWNEIFDLTGLSQVEQLIVLQPSAISGADAILESASLDLWKDYLAYHFVRTHAQYLPQEFDDANFEFFSKTLRGIEEQRERSKRGSDLVNASLGEAVGQIYVARHFPPASKTMMDQLVRNLRTAFRGLLKANEWMDDGTRAEALKKLGTFEARIGYTEKWIDYSTLEVVPGDLFGDSLRLTEFQWQQNVDRLGGPVDRQIWPYPPQTVNASYNPLLNQITFPAGILQPPFFDPNADPAVNYGAIGAVIGHEMGHGFDDQGREFDEKGLIRDWWSETANERYQKRADVITTQYNGYEPIEGMQINGALTLGENIGDLGGIEMAYAAYQNHLAANGGEAPVIDGYTGDQRFFLAFGQVWRAMIREDALREQLVTDPHSPTRYRANGVVRNVDTWYDAFSVGEADALYLAPEDRTSFW